MLFSVSHHSEVRWWGWQWPGGRCFPPLRGSWWPCESREQVDGEVELHVQKCVYAVQLAEHKPDLSCCDVTCSPHPTSIPHTHSFAASSLCKWCSGLIQRGASKLPETSCACVCVEWYSPGCTHMHEHSFTQQNLHQCYSMIWRSSKGPV